MNAAEQRELSQLASNAKRRRRVPAGSRCVVCSATRHLTVSPGGDARCYGHLRSSARGREVDHWASVGALPDAVIPLDANAHRDITELRRLLGFDDLPPADGDPRLLMAYLLMGIASLLVLFAQWLAECVRAQRGGLPTPAFPVVA